MTFTGSGDANTQEDKRPGQSEERAKQSLFVDAGCKEEGQEKPAPDAQRPDAQRPDAQRPGAQRPGAQRPDTQRPDAQTQCILPFGCLDM